MEQGKGEDFISFRDLMKREVISLATGAKIGYVDDLIIDANTAGIKALLVMGRSRFFGLLWRSDDLEIPWDAVEMIGKDTLLVREPGEPKQNKDALKSDFFARLWRRFGR